MKKLTSKIIAVFLAVLMAFSTAPLAALASTSASSALKDLSSKIDDYRAMMDGKNIYNNMAAAYEKYIEAVKVYDKAAYGASDVSEADITTATSNLNTAMNNMTVWNAKSGTTRPTNSSKGFNEDSSLTNKNNGGNYSSTRLFEPGTGNAYIDDVYEATYRNLGYVQRTVSSSAVHWTANETRKLGFDLYLPSAIVIFDGSNGFEARIGAMVQYTATSKDARAVAQVTVNGNDYCQFGQRWYQSAKNDGDPDSGTGTKKSTRYKNRDLVAAIASPSPTDYATGYGTAGTGTRHSETSLVGAYLGPFYIGNYLAVTIPNNTMSEDYVTVTSLPISSKSGNTTYSDSGSATATVSISILNYKKLIDVVTSTATKEKLKITEDNAYLMGGLKTFLQYVDAATSWNPNGVSNISTLVSTMNGYINNINNTTPAADSMPYGSLAKEMKGVLSTSGTLGRWYNVNNKTENYTDESIEKFVKAYAYTQSLFDKNTTFTDGNYEFTESSVTVGSGENAVTVNVPAAAMNAKEVYDMLHSAELKATARADASTLTMYIEELYDALDEFKAYGLTQTEIQNINDALENAKYRVWGNSTLTDEDTGETYTVSNYGDDGSLPSEKQQSRVTAQEKILKPMITALTIDREAVVTYNTITGGQDALDSILQRMASTVNYPRGNYINGDTLDEAIAEVNANFESELIPDGDDTLTPITEGCVTAKADEYKYWIQYCQDVIDALELTFLALSNGTIINAGTQEELIPKALEDKWSLHWTRMNNVVVFRTTKDAANLSLGSAGLAFTQGNTKFATGTATDYNSVLDSINIDDKAGASASINKEETGFGVNEIPSVELSADQIAKYPGGLTISTTNGGTYGMANVRGLMGRGDGSGGYLFGKTVDGSFTGALATTEGTSAAATGIYAFNNTTTLAAADMYLGVPATDPVTLTRTTVPSSKTYTAKGYFGSVFFWISDGFSLLMVKKIYTGYYHERTESQYTQTNTVVDISNLKELVNIVNGLVKNDYTEASWDNLKAKLAAATSNDFGSGKSYRDLTTANLVSNLTTRYQNLYDAWKALIPAATNIELTRPKMQAQNESKDIGAVVRDNSNEWRAKYLTNNDLSDENTYGTYTTNSWNAFKAAYEAGDAAIFGDGTNDGQYATPVYDANGETVVIGARGYARFVNSDGDPLDIGDLDALGLTINDIEAVEGTSGVSLSPAQQAINQLAADIKSTYINLKRWANFAPIDSAMTALKSYFESNYNKAYTVASLKNINTTFAALTTSYYTIENDVEAQHELNGSGIALYNEDNNDAIAAEAASIMSCIPPTASSMDIDVYTPAYIISMAENAASDPDAYDAAEAVELAEELAAEIYETVNIAPLDNLPVEGINFASNAEIDADLAEIMTHVNAIQYTVTINKADGTTETRANQTYGTAITLDSTSGKAVPWTYNYVSRTVKDQKPATIAPTAQFQFVVVGDTTVTEGQASNEELNGTTKLSLVDDLNHVYAIEYLAVGDSYTVNDNSIVINYANGSDSKVIEAPNYAFYNFNGFSKDTGTTVVIKSDTKSQSVTAMYEPDAEQEGCYLQLVFVSGDADSITSSVMTEEYVVNYNDKVELKLADLKAVKSGKKTTPGKFTVNGEVTNLATASVSVPVGGSIYAYTVVDEDGYEGWHSGRQNYGATAAKTETPGSFDDDFTYFPAGDTVIVIYLNENAYNTAITGGFVDAEAHANVKKSLVLSNSKFTMNGSFYLPDDCTLVECGVLMYLGNNDTEITPAQLELGTYNELSGAYRLKYTKSVQYKNINVSVNRKSLKGTKRIRYRAYVKYTTTDDKGKTVTGVAYSTIADTTQNFGS